MNLNGYVLKAYKYGLTPGFEKLDIKNLVKNMRLETDVLYSSLFQNSSRFSNNIYVKDNRLIAKNLANIFVVMCQVARHYNIDMEEAFNNKINKKYIKQRFR